MCSLKPPRHISTPPSATDPAALPASSCPLRSQRRFGTFQADDVRRLKQLEHENARLKKLVAERDLEIEVMKEINAKKW